MTVAKQTAERRQYPRYKMYDVAGVVGERRLGHVLDISEGGLAFSYIQLEEDNGKPVELGILFGPEGAYLEKLPHRVVSDEIFSQGPAYHPVVIRRQSLAFTGLTTEQRRKLLQFVRRHTRGAVRVDA